MQFITNIFDQVHVFWELFFITSTLPMLALLAVFLRKNIFKGKVKVLALILGFVPLSAIFIFTAGISIDDSFRESVELAALSTLIVIILRIVYYSYKHRDHDHEY